ncbi:MAG: AAA family ATPase [Clostridia bacterium]|nr:AAA family ATPase [Clostridia bacterium]
MKIIECYVENFGKISKQKFSFKDGTNCIKGDNGSGKSTLAAFIKVMLYGMGDTRKTSLEENDRKHYMPWQGGVCGGSLTFSAGGKTYRVERSFAPKAADDSYTLYDTATGRVCSDFPEGLGEGLFGIDADGFERTVFLSERALTPKSENKSISAKLSDLVGCDGDIGGMDEAMKVLEEKRKFYHKRGGSGELADRQAEINDIKRRLDALVEVEKAVEDAHGKMLEISARIEEARAEAKLILAEREKATVRAAEANHEKQYNEMKASLEESIRRRTIVGEVFGAEIPTFDDINEASYKATEAKNLLSSATDTPEIREFGALSARFDGKVERGQVEAARAAIKSLSSLNEKATDPRLIKAKKIFCGMTPSESAIDDIARLVENKKAKTPVGCIICYILFAVCCIAGIFIDSLMIAAGVVGILATLITEIAIKSKKNRARKEKIDDFFLSVSGVRVESDEEAEARLADMRELVSVMSEADGEDNREELMRAIGGLASIFPEYYGRDPVAAAEGIIRDFDKYAEMAVAERYMTGDRTARAARAERLAAEANAFVARFRTRTQDPFGEMRYALTEYERLTAEIVAKRDEIARLESLHTIGEGNQQKAAMEIEQLDRRRQENEKLVADLSRELTLTERRYHSYIDELDGRDELSMRKSELEEMLEKHRDNYETVMLTKKYITLAKDNMTARYLGKTKAGFIKYAEKIGGITGESFEMDTDFGVTKQEGASTRAVEAYSRGTRDLFNLAARLALVDSLYEKEKPFIILDDPFTAFDDEKTGAALKLLREFGKERQIIYFTCAEARSV